MRAKSIHKNEKELLKLLIRHLEDDDKAFIEIRTCNIPKTIHGELLSQSYGLYINNKDNEILIVKFCSILLYLCEENNKTVKEIIKRINEYDNNNSLNENDVYKYNKLNNKFISTFKNNRQVFELFKYILKTKICSSSTILCYWNWMDKNNVFDTLKVDKAMYEVKNGGKILDILKYTDAKVKCVRCGEVKHITYMSSGKNTCKECRNIDDALKYNSEQGIERYINTKKNKRISNQLENKIEKFKSVVKESCTDNEHSRDYIMYEAMYSTIINNIYDIIDLDIQNLSNSEKESIKSNNKELSKLIKKLEEKTWEQ